MSKENKNLEQKIKTQKTDLEKVKKELFFVKESIGKRHDRIDLYDIFYYFYHKINYL